MQNKKSHSQDTPSFLSLIFQNGVPKNALVVAIVVGSILNLINQGGVVLGETDPNFLKMGLTYLVPYLVSTHGQVMAEVRNIRINKTDVSNNFSNGPKSGKG